MLDALVIGAGPTGLTAALELARRGIAVRIIDKAKTPPADHSRALAVQARTLEIYSYLGLVDEAKRRAASNPAVNLVLPNGKTGRVPLVGFEGLNSPYAEMLMLPQDQNEELLAARLMREGVTPERGVELQSLEQRDGFVRCQLGGEAVDARYVIGADGAHSTVRAAAGIDFIGETYSDHCLLGEMELDWELPYGELILSPSRRGVVAAFPVPGKQRFRIICILPESHPGGREALSQAEFEGVLRELLPSSFRITKVYVLSRYVLHHRVAAHFRSGGLFLAGDAAHIHSPAGGQGMNTGIQDAWNLGWKIAAAVKGQLTDAELDSYEAERHPVAEKLVRFTDRAFGFMAGHGTIGTTLRFLAPRLIVRAFALRAFQHTLFEFVSQLRVRYHDGPLVRQEGRPPKGVPSAGERAPDVALDGGSLFSRLGTSWVLLRFGDVPVPPEAQRFNATHVVGGDEARRVYGASASVLIRPDGYIGVRVDGAA